MGGINAICTAVASYCLLVSCYQGTTETQQASNISTHAHSSTPSTEQATEISRPNPDYLKPGAAIRLEHDYDGQTAVGETELIELSFTEAYPQGELRVSLMADPGLLIEPQTATWRFAMDSDEPHTVQLTAKAEAPGKYYINIYASAVDEFGRPQDRVFALAIKVSNSVKSSKIQARANLESAAENLIYLPSTETAVK